MSKEWKIYTKTGDKGETSLIGGTRVPKYHDRIEAYGTLDELNSFIGHLRDLLAASREKEVLLEIQDRLFVAESILATDPDVEINRTLPRLQEADITLLEQEIDRMNESLPELASFILPGGHPVASLCHIARTVCRRAERICIWLTTQTTVNEMVIRYLNRLSDYLFVLARYESRILNGEEICWRPKP